MSPRRRRPLIRDEGMFIGAFCVVVLILDFGVALLARVALG